MQKGAVRVPHGTRRLFNLAVHLNERIYVGWASRLFPVTAPMLKWTRLVASPFRYNRYFRRMKQLLACLWLLASLTACKKGAEEPSATLAGPTWTLQSQVVVTTPKSGGASTRSPRLIPVGFNIFYTYRPDGTFLILEFNQPDTGTFTLVGPTLTLTSDVVGGRAPRVRTVAELSAHKLVTVESSEDSNNRYTDTVIATR